MTTRRRNSQMAREEEARRRDEEQREARRAHGLDLATKLTRIADDAADKLAVVVRSGQAEAGYVSALRLALQAGGALVERQKVEGTTEVRVVYAEDAPGTLPPRADDDDV